MPKIIERIAAADLHMVFLQQLFDFFFVLAKQRISDLNPPNVPGCAFLHQFCHTFSGLLCAL